MTDEDTYAQEYRRAVEVLGGAGYEHYELSNFTRPGRDSRHNRAYWRHRPYIGLGPGAHSYLPTVRSWNVRDWAEYRRRLAELDEYVLRQAQRVPRERRVLITAHDAFNYFGRAYGFEVRGLQGISTAS